jgi:hypothetical protein
MLKVKLVVDLVRVVREDHFQVTKTFGYVARDQAILPGVVIVAYMYNYKRFCVIKVY